MPAHMVRYTVKPDQVEHNDELVRAVIAELQRMQPAGLRYAAFKLDDGVSFVHLMWSDGQHARSSLRAVETLRTFHSGIRDRCEQAPVRTTLSEIGSFWPDATGAADRAQTELGKSGEGRSRDS